MWSRREEGSGQKEFTNSAVHLIDFILTKARDVLDSETVPQQKPDTVPQQKPDAVPQQKPDAVPQQKPDAVPQQKPDTVPQQKPDAVPQQKPDAVPQQKPDTVPSFPFLGKWTLCGGFPSPSSLTLCFYIVNHSRLQLTIRGLRVGTLNHYIAMRKVRFSFFQKP